MLTLYRPHGSNKYCAPAVLSILTGDSSDQGSSVLRDISGRRAIKGCGNGTLHNGICRVGFEASSFTSFATNRRNYNGCPTLNQWLADTDRTGKTFVVLSSHHFYIVQGDRYFDRAFNFDADINTVLDTPRGVKRRGRVVSVTEVNPKPVPSAAELLALWKSNTSN